MRSKVAQRMLDAYKAMPWYKRFRIKLRAELFTLQAVGLVKYLKHLI